MNAWLPQAVGRSPVTKRAKKKKQSKCYYRRWHLLVAVQTIQAEQLLDSLILTGVGRQEYSQQMLHLFGEVVHLSHENRAAPSK